MSMRAQYRERHIAIGRKAAYETEYLFEEDDPELTAPFIKPTASETSDDASLIAQPDSPISVASTLDIPGEMKSLDLPGSWVVIGKGGKPMKNGKMYDEPVTTALKKKKKKQRSRSRKDDAFEAEPLVAILEETASSSKCLRELHTATIQREKLVARAQDAKRWARYRRCKQLNLAAVEQLVAALSLAAADDEQEGAPAQALPTAWTGPVKDNKANSRTDKARRRARSAALAALCALGDADEHDDAVFAHEPTPAPPPTPMTTRVARPRQVRLHAEWTTVGKRGKAVPPHGYAPTEKLTPNGTSTSGNKRLEPSEQLASKPASKRGKSADKSKKCDVM